MASFWETKYKNAERSISFIQEAHAEVLRGLHEEIETLQKQCSEFALKLSIASTSHIDKEEYERKFLSFNNDYRRKDSELIEQKRILDEKSNSINALQVRVKMLENKLESELTNKDQIIDQLKQKLEMQSNQLAQLTYQLYQNKKSSSNKQHQQQQPLPNNNSNNETHHLNVSIDSTRTTTTTSLNKFLSLDAATHTIKVDNIEENVGHYDDPISAADCNDNNDNNLLHVVPVPPSIPQSTDAKTSTINSGSRMKQMINNNNINSIFLSQNSAQKQQQQFKSTSLLMMMMNNNHPRESIDFTASATNNNIEVDLETIFSNVNLNDKTLRPCSSSCSTSLAVNSEMSTPLPKPPLTATIGAHKVLPPVIKRPPENKAPDPKPFLISAAASTLHTRTKKELLSRKTLVSLPPIKPFEVVNQHLVVDSPFKTTTMATTSTANAATNQHNTNTSN